MRSLACLLLLFASAFAHADPEIPSGEVHFRVFAGSDGLTNLVVMSVTQDANGMLWVATDDGVFRFDGDRFAHFTLDDGLISSTAHVLGLGLDGRPCVGSSKGMVCWNGAQFTRVGLPASSVTSIVHDDDLQWIGTDLGLFVRDRDGAVSPASTWSHGPVRALWLDKHGPVVGTDHGAWIRGSRGDWELVPVPTERVDSVVRDGAETLWVRTASHLWKLPVGAAVPEDLQGNLASGYDTSEMPNGMALDGDGNIVIGTDLGIVRPRNGRWQVIGRAEGLPGSSVRAVFVDREGTLWVGSKGLFQLRGRGLIERYDVDGGFPGEVTWTFKRDPQGKLLVGTSRCLAHIVMGRWQCIAGTEGRVVRSIAFPPQGGMFVGGASSDLLYLDHDGKPSSVADFGTVPGHNILALTMFEGDLWIATATGLFRLRGAVPGALERIHLPQARAVDRFASLAVTGDRLWVANEDGAFVREAGVWKRFDNRDGLRSTSVRYVIGTSDGRLCVAYREAIGVSCFHYDGHHLSDFEHWSVASGLTSGMAYFLGEDRKHRLWVGSGDGIDIVSGSSIDHLDESDGLAGNDSAATAFLLDPDGSVWLGSTGGATHVLAQSYTGAPPPPRSQIVSAQLGEQALEDGEIASHDRNTLSINIAPDTLLYRSRIEFEVQLSPGQSHWTTTRDRAVHYPALPPGQYRFEVRARIGAGAWGPATQFTFEITPAWWQTTWAAGLLVVACLLAIGATFAIRQRVMLRRQTRQLNDTSEASFRAVFDEIPELIALHRDRSLTYLNRAHRRFLGFSDDDDQSWRTVRLMELVHRDDRGELEKLFHRIYAGSTGNEPIEIRAQGARGEWRVCEVSGVLVDIGGQPTVVSSARDVTERNRMRAKLVMSDRMASLGTLAAGIAHEINNPLTYVMGNLEVVAEIIGSQQITDETGEPADVQSLVADARDGANRVRKIVQGLRAFSRSEGEVLRPVDVVEVLETAVRLTSNDVKHRARLVRELARVPIVHADESRLTQVFINLIVNAAQSIPNGNSDANLITIRALTEKDSVVIEIEDSGVGIDPDVRARVFDPFFTTKQVGVGTGLGLSICHGIITGFNGQITLEPAPVRGTVVRVCLPAADVVADAPVVDRRSDSVISPKPHPAPTGLRRRVLVVDDEPIIVQMLVRMLGSDHDVTTAVCGADALQYISAGKRFDAIISDVMMPNMTGLELAVRIAQIDPAQARRLAFVTGGVFVAETRAQIDELGLPQLHKPLTNAMLRDCIAAIAAAASSSTNPPRSLPSPASSLDLASP